jgi:TM2 domain-containing membrane protein YozV
MRTPIYYDSNNTGYYLNPSAAGGNSLKTIGDWRQNTDGWSGEVGGKMQYHGSNWYIQAANSFIYRNSAGANQFYVDNTGTGVITNYLTGANSLRAPIFYDSNDTGYYVDPAANSYLNTGTLAGRWSFNNYIVSGNEGGMMGSYNVTSTAAKCIWTIGESWPLANMYGLAYEYNGTYGHHLALKNNGTTYQRLSFASQGNYFTGTTKHVVSSHAPIFYELNNTTYYLDPASTGTSLNVAGDVVGYSSSDIRYKDNVKPIENALDKIDKIKGYTFEWNELSHKQTGKKDIGVIAQEVEEILPEIIDTRSDGYKAVDYPKLTALLIQSVKEQQIIINDLKSRIEKLEL